MPGCCVFTQENTRTISEDFQPLYRLVDKLIVFLSFPFLVDYVKFLEAGKDIAELNIRNSDGDSEEEGVDGDGAEGDIHVVLVGGVLLEPDGDLLVWQGAVDRGGASVHLLLHLKQQRQESVFVSLFLLT